MNRRPISTVARPLPWYTLPAVFSILALLLWALATTNNSRQLNTPQLGAANPRDAAPRLVSSLSEIEFGTVKVGESVSKRLMLTNSSLDDEYITVSSTWLSEPDALEFESDFKGPRTLSAGDSLVINLNFTPSKGGFRIGALYVSHDGDSNLDIYTLSGNGAIPESSEPSLGAASPVMDPAFGKSVLAGFTDVKPTSLQFGPDGRLYVADMLGLIKAFEIERDDANSYRVLSEETITLIRDIPNHDDDGTLNGAVSKRLVTGLLVAGTASSPVIYVGSSDPRIGGGPSHTETGLDTNSGIISRLTRTANGSWQKLDLVRGLPRSEENHTVNGMAINEASQLLYVTTGGNTNQGGPSNNFANLPEYALSTAILEVNLGMIGESTYDLPTLDDETRSGTQDSNDPFGGNDGRNQAKLVPGGPVQVYAPGFRNPYDIVLTDDNRMYTVDNGPNAGWGGMPIGEGANGTCTNGQSEPGNTFFDSLHWVSERGYYGGHPNPTRANPSNTFNTSNPQSPVSVPNPIECVHRGAGGDAALTTFGYSTNGLDEYRASNFGGAMQGDLLAAGWNNSIQRLVLNNSGSKLTNKEALFTNVGGLPLDVTAQSDSQYFPGTIWVADFVDKKIVVFEPVDYDGVVTGVCGGTPSSDDDNDGFSNDDELANGTNPCSAADIPADLDGDFLSDRTDADDDNDGIDDKYDPFPLDPDNGRGTTLPVAYEWENDSESAGFLFNLGFSGLMNNGASEYLDLFSLENMTTGGAAGVLTIDEIPAGDPIAGVNNQAYAYQFGIDVTPTTDPFTVHTRLLSPFVGASIGGYQSMGFYIGTGDQDNYIKLVMNSRGPTGGVQFAAEREGKFEQVDNVSAPIFGQSEVDLYLSVDPAAGTVRAFYSNNTDDNIVEVGSATALPQSWLTATSGLAVGIISTSYGGPTFGATWDFMQVTYGPTEPTDSEGSNNDTGGTDTGAESENETETSTSKVHTAVDGLIAIEAEHAVDNVAAAGRSWVAGSSDGARDNASMIANPDGGLIRFTNADSPHLGYQVDFPDAGTWYVWVRGLGDAVAGEGKNDSVHVGLNGTLAGASAMQGFPASGWAWSNATRATGVATVQVATPGLHTIDVWMREDGFELDALVLTMDGGYIPDGVGPAEHHQNDGNDDDSTESATTDGASSTGGDEGTDTTGGSGTGTGDSEGSDDGTDTGDSEGSDTGSSEGSDTGSDDGTGTGGSESNDTGSDDGTDTTEDNSNSDTGGDSGTDGNSTDTELVVIEAEGFSSKSASGDHAWTPGARSGSSGGSMITTPDVGALMPGATGTPVMHYKVDFPSAGSWRVWVRGWGDAINGEGKSDSLHVGINGTLSATAMQGFPSGGWAWSNATRGSDSATVQVDSAGQHTIDVWMREDGLEIDALLFTTDTNYVPSGVPGNSSEGSGTSGNSTGADDGSGGDTADDPEDGNTSGEADDSSRASATRDWQTRSSVDGSSATARHEAGAVEFDGKLYLLGGRGSRPIDIYDPATQRWSKGESAPFEVHHFQPVALNGKIWIVGAMTCCYPQEDNVSHVWTYTPASNSWQKDAEIPATRRRGSTATVVRNGKIYLAGGNTKGHNGGAVKWFDEFDPSTGAWRQLPDILVARDHAQGGLIDNKLVLAAGRRSTQPYVFSNTIAQVDVYDFTTGNWSRGKDILTTRAGTMAVTVGREVLVIGGESAAQTAAHNEVEAYDVDDNSWRALRSLKQGRHSGGAVRLDDEVHVVSGAITKGGADETTSHESLGLD